MSTCPAAESLSLINVGDHHDPDPHRGAGFQGASAAGRVVANWHNEHHRGAFSMCSEQPCHAVLRVDK